MKKKKKRRKEYIFFITCVKSQTTTIKIWTLLQSQEFSLSNYLNNRANINKSRKEWTLHLSLTVTAICLSLDYKWMKYMYIHFAMSKNPTSWLPASPAIMFVFLQILCVTIWKKKFQIAKSYRNDLICIKIHAFIHSINTCTSLSSVINVGIFSWK